MHGPSVCRNTYHEQNSKLAFQMEAILPKLRPTDPDLGHYPNSFAAAMGKQWTEPVDPLVC